MVTGRSAVGAVPCLSPAFLKMSVVVLCCPLWEREREGRVYSLQWLGSKIWKISPMLHKILNLAHRKAINLAAEWQHSQKAAGTFRVFSKPEI